MNMKKNFKNDRIKRGSSIFSLKKSIIFLLFKFQSLIYIFTFDIFFSLSYEKFKRNTEELFFVRLDKEKARKKGIYFLYQSSII